MTLLEILIAATITIGVVFGTVSALRNQADVLGHVANNGFTVSPAHTALWKIRNELLSVTQDPPGVTNAVAPSYAVVSPNTGALPVFSSITWRPSLGYVEPTDPNYATYKSQGRVSNNNVLYDSVARRLWVNTVAVNATTSVNLLQLDTLSGPPASVVTVRSEVLLGNAAARQTVTEFRLFDAEVCAPFPLDLSATASIDVTFARGATNATYCMGVYLRVQRPSANANDYSSVTGVRVMDSNYDNRLVTATDLRMAVLVAPETIVVTAGKPFVGP